MPKQPPIWLVKISLLFCMYIPAGLVAFSEPYVLSDDRVVFFMTFPGEWFAQRCGGRAYDYYWVAGIATVLLFHTGLFASRIGWYPLLMAMLTLGGWSVFTMDWVVRR